MPFRRRQKRPGDGSSPVHSDSDDPSPVHSHNHERCDEGHQRRAEFWEAKVYIQVIDDLFEFTDTDSDRNRLEMLDGKLHWLEPDDQGGSWRKWAQAPFKFDGSSGRLTSKVGHATMRPEDKLRFIQSLEASFAGDESRIELLPLPSESQDTARTRRKMKRQQARGEAMQGHSSPDSGPSTAQSSSEVAAITLRSDASCSLPSLHESRSEAGGMEVPRTYAELSQHRSPMPTYLTPIRCDGSDTPVGLRYDDGKGDTYEVDVVRMIQTHVESGSVRRIRREKPNLWRYFKRGGSWGSYPREVSIELDRVYLASCRGKAASWDRDEEQPAKKQTVATPEAAAALTPGVAPSARALAGQPLDAVLIHLRSLPDGGLGRDASVVASELLFAAVEAQPLSLPSVAMELLELLCNRFGYCCGVSEARRAGLVVGSMRLLRVVFASVPNSDLVGQDIFDRKYPRLRMNDAGRKNCIRSLLARGMMLGRNDRPPKSKLLYKVEADAYPQWANRCVDGLLRACPLLPESIRSRVLSYLGLDGDSEEVFAQEE